MPAGRPPHTRNRAAPIPGVEGVRAIAAASVLVYHCWRYGAEGGSRAHLGLVNRFVLPHLPLGVTLFFSLSGFLLYQPFVAAALSGSPFPNLRAYLRNRALRILPAYWVILVAVGVLLPAALLHQSRDPQLALGRLVEDPGLAVRNATLTQGYSPSGLLTGIGPAWSLAVEVVFYLTLPLLGLLAVVAARRANSSSWRLLAGLAPAGLLLVVGLSGRAVARFLVPPAGGVAPGWDWHAVIASSFWGKADLFSFGMALAVLYVGVRQGLVRLPGRWPLLAVAGAAATAVPTLLLVDRWLIDTTMYAYQLPTSLACTLLLGLVVLPDQAARFSPLLRVLTSRPLVAVGLASYSLFLWHEPLERLLHEGGLTLDGTGGFVVNLAVLGVLSGLLSALTYRYVERPALRRKTRPQPQPAGQTSQPLAS
jgi:peptidoglycan/LPS O-acetylase OafA/YrhL